MQLMLKHISYAHPDSALTLFSDVSVTLPLGWTGVVGANGAGKTTLLRIATSQLLPQAGSVASPGDALYCEQPTSSPPGLLDEFAQDWGADAGRLRSLLRIGDDWPWRFDTLSHGERKRLQLAIALWRRTPVLAVDEPTNHLDSEARDLVIEALKRFDGVGLIVSHDRDLLDTLAEQCLFVVGGDVRLRPGTYSEAKEQAELERRATISQRASAKREVSRLQAEGARRRNEADRAQGLRSRSRVDPGDRDAKGRIGLAIVSGKDGQAGRLSAQMKSRMKRAQDLLDDARVEKVLGGAGISLTGGASRRDTVAKLCGAKIHLTEERVLVAPELTVASNDRVAIIGANGAGKSTLLRHLARGVMLSPETVLDVPQEPDPAMVSAIHRELVALGADERGATLAFVARLGSDPERVLAGEALSPGEVRKLMIAMGAARHPQLILLDEPTNHLDIVAAEALEEALAEYKGALVFVSHDSRFIERLATTVWRLEQGGNGETSVVVGDSEASAG